MRDSRRLAAQYLTMRRIRAFEHQAETMARDGKVTGAVHASVGQEGIAVGVCANLLPSDKITTTHRGHGHCIAKGTSPRAMMLELFGKAGGTSGGKGGSMHIADFSVGMLGANGVVADGLPIAVGAAQGEKLLGRDTVVCCFFGDGATNRGPFMEALNWAAVYTLPVLFVCENNSYASTTRTATVTAGPGPSARAESLGVPAFSVDGNDVVAVDELTGRLVREIRAGAGPKFIEAHTYRLHGHTAADAGAYRDAREVEERWNSEPIARCAAELRRLGVPDSDIKAMDEAAEREMAEAVAIALAAPWPDPRTAFTDVQDVGAPV